jgi:hypothetical protein
VVVFSGAGVLLLLGVEGEYEILVAAVPIFRFFSMDFVCDKAPKDIVFIVGEGFDDNEAKRMSLE